MDNAHTVEVTVWEEGPGRWKWRYTHAGADRVEVESLAPCASEGLARLEALLHAHAHARGSVQ